MEARHAPKRQRTAAAAQQQQQQQQPAAARSSSAVQPAAAGSSGAGGAGDLHSLLLSREQLLAALPLERALQGSGTGLSLLSGLLVRIKKRGAYCCRAVSGLAPDGLLDLQHEALRCQPSQVSGSTAAGGGEWWELQALLQAAGQAPWSAAQMEALQRQRQLAVDWPGHLARGAASGEQALQPLQLAQLISELFAVQAPLAIGTQPTPGSQQQQQQQPAGTTARVADGAAAAGDSAAGASALAGEGCTMPSHSHSLADSESGIERGLTLVQQQQPPPPQPPQQQWGQPPLPAFPGPPSQQVQPAQPPWHSSQPAAWQEPVLPDTQPSSPPPLPPPADAALPPQQAPSANRSAAALFGSSSDEEEGDEEDRAQRQPQQRQRLQARGQIKFKLASVAAGSGENEAVASHVSNAPPQAAPLPAAAAAAGAATLETSPPPLPAPSPEQQAAALAAALASAPAAGSFWDPTWELEARCVHLLSHCGPLPEAVLLQSLHITQLPPFLRDTPAEPVPRTMQRFLQERPALFAPCDATPGHDSAWAAVPGAAAFLRYKRALLEHLRTKCMKKAKFQELSKAVPIDPEMTEDMRCQAGNLAQFCAAYLPDCIWIDEQDGKRAHLRPFESEAIAFPAQCHMRHLKQRGCPYGVQCQFCHAPPRGRGSIRDLCATRVHRYQKKY